MKKLTILVSAVAILLAVTGVASASAPETVDFRIDGITTSVEQWPPKPPNRGPLSGRLTAGGTVTGDLEGQFSFQETVIFNPVSGRGPNRGTMTITTGAGDMVVVRFTGQTDGLHVEGQFTVVGSTGKHAGLHGQGVYAGFADICDPLPPDCEGFFVDFTGRFHTDQSR